MPTSERTNAEKVGDLVKQVDQAIIKARNRVMAEYDLTATQADLLRYIRLNSDHEINQVELERAFHLTNPTITGILKRLEAKGFIVKRPSQKDCRHKSICATDRATALFQSGWQTKAKIEKWLLQGLSQDEIDATLRALEIMLGNMEHMAQEP